MDPIDTMQADPNHPEAKRSPSTSNIANHENSQVASEPQSSSLYSMNTRTARAAPINFLVDPEDNEVPPPQRSPPKRTAAKANFEKKVAYPLRPTRTQFKSTAASSEQAPRPASNPVTFTLEKENVPTSPRQVLPRLSTTEEDSTAVYERWADGRWYELTLDGVPSPYSGGSWGWCIAALYYNGLGPQSFRTALPTETDVQWRALTIGEVNKMLSARYN
ncbi:hypothetical protein LTR56_021521 [Elasticomyces elasticus]|nr:hypothetical protein LTR56_021521 [Elasticomyces elasticus]KAK3631260.1 hypothetical protein LTR22_021144 [Elasticomyces elasticus]